MSPALSGGFPAEGDWPYRWEVPDARCAASSAFGRGLATATLRDAQGTLSVVRAASPLGEATGVIGHRVWKRYKGEGGVNSPLSPSSP